MEKLLKSQLEKAITKLLLKKEENKKLSKYKIYKNRRTRYHPSIQISEDEKYWDNFYITHKPNRNDYIKLPEKINPNDFNDSYISKKLHHDFKKVRGKEIKGYKISDSNEKFIDDLVKNNRKKRGVSLNCDAPYKKGQTPSEKIKSKKK